MHPLWLVLLDRVALRGGRQRSTLMANAAARRDAGHPLADPLEAPEWRGLAWAARALVRLTALGAGAPYPNRGPARSMPGCCAPPVRAPGRS